MENGAPRGRGSDRDSPGSQASHTGPPDEQEGGSGLEETRSATKRSTTSSTTCAGVGAQAQRRGEAQGLERAVESVPLHRTPDSQASVSGGSQVNQTSDPEHRSEGVCGYPSPPSIRTWVRVWPNQRALHKRTGNLTEGLSHSSGSSAPLPMRGRNHHTRSKLQRRRRRRGSPVCLALFLYAEIR